MPQLSLHSPFGALTLSEEEGYIVSLDEGWGRDQTETPLLIQVRELLQNYFDGQPVDFSTLPLMLHGTDYQKCVWKALRQIPYGHTRRYSDLASEIGGSARSVGRAVGANPILLLVPCHRVVGAHGLCGYSGFNGIDDKARLLDLEGRL
ncbi:methylated-DNA--[protein]-cysteine S-methyltransferase [Saccharibacter sp. 17.LH.SD]|uniref:methylated-DNA--[protein]-cysteine S-methyltransferase n=1 Tax=Saccharibacter sp. 17.LH.SD TaxID=2689393 RepID=UPI00136C7C50|nr:methylated-DNA--[protein]-cysteine S-methyltransferase [Saccharibacter sp. 17.LH.SD]MXV45141.1 methylated-DNA--[protein]-cysteine S-methyltransferase [Saccharibacter sp. 17.LH.SD]